MQENENKRPLRRREAQQILQALEAGVVPTMGIQHLLVGRQAEVEEVAATLARVAEGDSDFRVWVGDFGSGKSFMLHTIEQLALQINMAAATVDLTPTRRFHASDGKGVALYQEIMKRLQTRAAAPGEALGAMLDRWYDNVVQQKRIRQPSCMTVSIAFRAAACALNWQRWWPPIWRQRPRAMPCKKRRRCAG